MKINKLINKGLIIVYGTMVTFVILGTLIAFWIIKDILKLDYTDIYSTVTLFVFISMGWLWWSYKIVKWKIMAFSQLTLTESFTLYEKAISVGLIWPTGSIFNKTEIRTKEDHIKWLNIDPEIREIFQLDDA